MKDDELKKWAKDNLEYRNGELYWKIPKPNRKMNASVGAINGRGYKHVGVKVKDKTHYFLIHRLVYLLHHGYNPESIDHIDGNKLNNAIENLREATNAENMQNTWTQKNSTTGVKGVHAHKLGGWVAEVMVEGKRTRRYHKDRELIELVAFEMREKYHRSFARHG
jgi:hypothetical protein